MNPLPARQAPIGGDPGHPLYSFCTVAAVAQGAATCAKRINHNTLALIDESGTNLALEGAVNAVHGGT